MPGQKAINSVTHSIMKRNNRSLAEKIEIIDAVEKAGPFAKKAKIAADFGIPANTLTNIMKNKETLRARFNSGSSSLTSQRLRTSNAEKVDKLLFNWFNGARAANITITGDILREKAQKIAGELEMTDWECNNSWISRWKTRYNISLKVISGEGSAVDMDVVSDFKSTVLPTLLEGYEPRDVFNADETGMFWRATPTTTLELKGKKCYGGKLSKERITLLVAANADGTEKLPLLSIGKFKNPRCFKNIKQKPLDYEHNTKAWMTADLFTSWVKRFDAKMVRQKRKVILFIDNCCAHPQIHGLRAVTLQFLPPNTTALSQPCDAGIIKNLKHHYRKKLMNRMLTWYDSGKDMKEFHVTLLDALIMLKEVWDDNVSAETIRNCFRHCGFFVQPSTALGNEGATADSEEEVCEDFRRLQQLHIIDPDIHIRDVVAVDAELTTSDFPEETITEVEEEAAAAAEDDEDDCGDPPSWVTTKQAEAAVQLLKIFILQRGLDDATVRNVEKLVTQHRSGAIRQSTLDSYFESK